MDKNKNNHGGKRQNSGRKSKAEEQKLAEKLAKFDDKAMAALENAIEEEQSWAIKLYMEYMYGRPKMQVDMDLTGNVDIATSIFGADVLKDTE